MNLKTIPKKLIGNIRRSVETLKTCSKNLGGPEEGDLYLVFLELDSYPEMEENGGANHEVGYLRGVAEALDCDPAELLDL